MASLKLNAFWWDWISNAMAHGTRHANMKFFTKRRREFDLFITVSFKLSIGIHSRMCMPKELGCNRLSFPILFRSNLMQTKRCFCLLFTFHIHSNLFLAFDYTKCLIVTRTGFFPIFAAIIHFVYCLHFLAISRTLNNKETIHSFELFLLIFLIFIAYSTVFIVINTTVTRFDIYYCCNSNLLLLKFFRIGCLSYCNAVVRSKL